MSGLRTTREAHQTGSHPSAKAIHFRGFHQFTWKRNVTSSTTHQPHLTLFNVDDASTRSCVSNAPTCIKVTLVYIYHLRPRTVQLARGRSKSPSKRLARHAVCTRAGCCHAEGEWVQLLKQDIVCLQLSEHGNMLPFHSEVLVMCCSV